MKRWVWFLLGIFLACLGLGIALIPRQSTSMAYNSGVFVGLAIGALSKAFWGKFGDGFDG